MFIFIDSFIGNQGFVEMEKYSIQKVEIIFCQTLTVTFRFQRLFLQYRRSKFYYFIYLLIFAVFIIIILNCFAYFYHNPFLIKNTSIATDNDFSKCKLCNFTPVIFPNSSGRDAVFTMLTKFGPGSERLIRSLRTTGSKAKIFIFTPEGVLLPEWVFECGVRQVFMGPMTSRTKKSPYKIRWEWYYEFLKENVNDFDRILHTDAFDVFFFGDPFAFAPDKSALYFQMEDRPIRDCPYNKQWVLACHFDMNRYALLYQTIACSGSLLGGAQSFLQFTEILVTHREWALCWGKGFDQGDFNYVLYHDLPYTNLTQYFMDCNSGFMTYNYCVNEKRMFNENSQPITRDGTLVTFAHQYNRFSAVNLHIQSLCGV